MLAECCRQVANRYRIREYKAYLRRKRARLQNRNFTIISSNCVGAFMYRDLGLPYLSPTINLSVGMNEFVKMAGNLRWYMAQEIVRIEDNTYGCPAGLLGDVVIKFVHYKSYDEAAEKWNERKRRINWDNLFLVGTERGDCNYEIIERFDRLPYQNKVVFTHIQYPEFHSAYYIKGFEKEKELGILVDYKEQLLLRRYMDDFDYVAFLNGSMF